MNKAVFLIRKKYNKALKNLMSMDDKFDLAIHKVNEQIVKYGAARTAIISVENWEQTPALRLNKKKIEKAIEDLVNKKEEYSKKKAEYIAKEQILKAQKQAAEACANLDGFDFCNFDSFLNEMDTDLRTMEAEIDTLNFVSAVKVSPGDDKATEEETIISEEEN